MEVEVINKYWKIRSLIKLFAKKCYAWQIVHSMRYYKNLNYEVKNSREDSFYILENKLW